MPPHRTEHLRHWPPGLPHRLTLPQTNLFHNVEVSAARYPDKPFIVFYDTVLSFAEFKDEAERIAGFLQQECGRLELGIAQESALHLRSKHGLFQRKQAHSMVVDHERLNDSRAAFCVNPGGGEINRLCHPRRRVS